MIVVRAIAILEASASRAVDQLPFKVCDPLALDKSSVQKSMAFESKYACGTLIIASLSDLRDDYKTEHAQYGYCDQNFNQAYSTLAPD